MLFSFYSLSLFFVVLSLFTGTLVLIVRLYNFRLQRHITLVRQRFYKQNRDKITTKNRNAALLPQSDFNYPNFSKRIIAVLKIIFVKIEFLKKSEMTVLKTDFPLSKFNNIKEHSFRLGVVSWKWTKLQGLYFLVGVILYGIYLWIK